MAVGKKIVVFDAGMPQLMDNKLFNRKEAGEVSHTILPTCYLFEQTAKQDITMMTSDVYFKNYNDQPALLISALYGPDSKKLIEAGVKPIILTCMESPFIATRFYLNLKKISKLYKHSFVFSGMKKQLSGKTVYHQMFFPQPFNFCDYPPVDYDDKFFLVAVISAKGIEKFKSYIKSFLLNLFYGGGIKEIYSERTRAVNYFSNQAGFDLYGYGWDKVKSENLDSGAIGKCYRGTIENKLAVLNKYRFALCFENAISPGYITEKIFDVMNAGCVPIYCGTSDIKNFVPAGCFVDKRNFGSLKELHDFLLKIDKNEYDKYLNNIKNYLNSDEYKKFTQEYFAEQIMTILKKEF